MNKTWGILMNIIDSFIDSKLCIVFDILAIYVLIFLLYNHYRLQNEEWDDMPDDANITCYSDEDGILIKIDEKFSPSNDSIFFHETSCKGGLTSRQACAIEAAARSVPSRKIYVIFAGPVKDLNQSSFTLLKSFKNLNFYRVNLVNYAKGTPLESLVSGGLLYKSRWKISHTSDLLRYLSLYKWGGIYLDLDTVVVKNLDPLGGNWAARESKDAVAAGAMAFSKQGIGKKIAEAAVRDLAKNWRGDTWGQNGPLVITRVLKEICNTDDVTLMSANTCQGFEVYDYNMFYPENADEYFKPQSRDYPDAHVYHVWNKKTESLAVHNDSLYATLAERYCPTVYNTYRDKF